MVASQKATEGQGWVEVRRLAGEGREWGCRRGPFCPGGARKALTPPASSLIRTVEAERAKGLACAEGLGKESGSLRWGAIAL